MSVGSRIKRLFSTKVEPSMKEATKDAIEETEQSKKILNHTIKRAQKTMNRIEKHSAQERERAERLIVIANEAVDQLKRALN